MKLPASEVWSDWLERRRSLTGLIGDMQPQQQAWSDWLEGRGSFPPGWGGVKPAVAGDVAV